MSPGQPRRRPRFSTRPQSSRRSVPHSATPTPARSKATQARDYGNARAKDTDQAVDLGLDGPQHLRPRAGRSRWRPTYRQIDPMTFVILAVAPEAQIDARGFNAAVARAVQRYAGLEGS